MLSIDIGTSQSAVCVLVLPNNKNGEYRSENRSNNNIPRSLGFNTALNLSEKIADSMKNVTGWPGQTATYEAKIPSVLLYDSQNKVCAYIQSPVIRISLHKGTFFILCFELVACGAEAMNQWDDLGLNPQECALIENFKMYLHENNTIPNRKISIKGRPSTMSPLWT